MSLLRVENLSITINSLDGPLQIVKNVSLSLESGKKLGIVGESGCGKSMTALAMMSLLPSRSSTTGGIWLNQINLRELDDRLMCGIRGNKIGMIFQEPMTALNPVKTIGAQIAEPLILHQSLSKGALQEKVKSLMSDVGMPVSRFPLKLYPHQLSGGQRQRIMIAMAIACDPDLLIADEPTTALDVTVQEQILDLIVKLTDKFGMSLLMISHDLGVIAQTTDNVIVMYAGRVMESGTTLDVFKRMSHPYTKGLFSAIPKPGLEKNKREKRLPSIPGQVPDPQNLPGGCVFSDRCQFKTDICTTKEPPLLEVNPHHFVWCYHPVSGNQE